MNYMERSRSFVSALMIGAAFATSVYADDKKKEEPKEKLDKVVVTATRHNRILKTLPYTVWKLEAPEIQLEKQSRSLTEALAETPGVMLQKTGHGMTSPYLRGVTAQRVVLVADGIRMNNSFLREGPNQYWNLLDHYCYENVDVLLGPASVLYGSDAIGGVVHAQSSALQRGAANGGVQWMGGSMSMRGASAERSLSENLKGSAALDDDYTMSWCFTRQDFGDLRSGDSTDNDNSGYEQWSANLRMRDWIDDNSSILFGYDRFDQDDVNRVHRTVDHVDYRGTSTKGGTSDLARIYDHDHELAFARYELRGGDGLVEEMDLGVHYRQLIENYERIRGSGRRDERFTRVETLGFNFRLQSNIGLGTLNSGVDYYHDNVNSNGVDDVNGTGGGPTPRIQGVVADDARYDLTGAYLQLESEISSRFESIVGVRYTYADLDAGTVNYHDGGPGRSMRGNWDAVTGSARLLYHASEGDKLNLFLGVSQGFRAPNLSDTTRDDEWGGGTEEPTADLDEETFTTYEVGTKASDTWGYLNLAYFYTQIKDRIGRLSTPTTKRNLDEGHIYGAELMFGLKVGENFIWRNGIAYQYGEERMYQDRNLANPEVDTPMSRIAPLNGFTALRWQQKGNPFWAEVSMDWAEEQDRYSYGDAADNRFPPGGTPAWQCYNIRTGWSVSESLDLALALENVTDRNYRIHGSGINEPGRNAVATIKYSF